VDQLENIPHTDFDELQFEQIVNAGIAAARGGDLDQARALLIKATEMKPSDSRPWLWLSVTTEDLDEQRNYLERSLAADPTSAAARRGLLMLSDKLDQSRHLEEEEGPLANSPAEPEEAHTAQIFACPQCGGAMEFDLDGQNLVCTSCKYTEPIETDSASTESTEQVANPEPIDIDLTSTESAEQVPNPEAIETDFTSTESVGLVPNPELIETDSTLIESTEQVPSPPAFRWAEAQHRLICGQCGSVSLLPPGQTAGECPYCGSRRMIPSTEAVELVDPQVIGLARLKEEQAIRRLRAWLGNGWFIPDGLKSLARTSRMRPAYYPFWTFDGTLKMSWTCQVNDGTSSNPQWAARQGVESEMFKDVLVPGLRSMQIREISRVGPFRLKDLVEFKPELLAGWIALTNDLPLANASDKARENVVRKLRRELYNRVLPGYEKRDLSGGGVDWSELTYKLALLPLWVGTYRYRGKSYRLLVNGQTGKVGGEKPIDVVKLIVFVFSIVLTILVLALSFWALGLIFGWFTL